MFYKKIVHIILDMTLFSFYSVKSGSSYTTNIFKRISCKDHVVECYKVICRMIWWLGISIELQLVFM